MSKKRKSKKVLVVIIIIVCAAISVVAYSILTQNSTTCHPHGGTLTDRQMNDKNALIEMSRQLAIQEGTLQNHDPEIENNLDNAECK
jgi:flagellar basal body-associated protein FliL